MAEGTRQGSGIIQLGTPANPTLYTTRILQGPSEWQRIAIAFIATAPTLRIALLGQAAGPGNTVEYDGIRFLPPGRNPVLVMAAIFARFLPHLTLDAASVAAAAERRNEWLFSGYIPDPGRTDQLLTKMSQECFCTLFKDLDGIYKITADDPDHTPLLHLDSQHDVIEATLEVQGLPMEEVYTDFYVWYQRVTTQVTTSQAGQYAAVLYATPDASISQYSELQTLCQQAADTFATRTRFDFYSDFIADPATADLLLARLVRQLSALRQDVTLQATLPAVPLSLTDHVAVHAPLLGPAPFVGALRRAELAFAAQPPGMALSLTLRQSGLARGVWEAWDVGALGFGDEPGGGGPGGSWPPGTPRVRETWPDMGTPVGGPWHEHSDFPTEATPIGTLYALRGLTTLVGIGSNAQLWAASGGPLPEALSLQIQAPVWRFTDAEVASGHWSAGLTAGPATGRGTALGLTNEGGGSPVLYVACERSTGTSEVWQLHTQAATSEDYLALTLPAGTQGWSMQEHNFFDGNGNGLYIGTAPFARIYRFNLIDTTTVVLSEGAFGRRFRSLAIDPVTGAFWAAADNVAVNGAGSTVMYHLTTATGGYNSHTLPAPATQTCNMVVFGGTLWTATGVEDGSQISVWSITPGVGAAGRWDRRFTFTGLTNQQPGCLAVFDGSLWLGRLSSTTEPMLQILRSADGLDWQVGIDLATGAGPDQTGPGWSDPNTSVTAMAVARGRLYVATGVPYGGPAPGARVYCYPTPEGITA